MISDIHFSVNNLELASKSLEAALAKAEDLQIPLIIAGDLNDTKAIIRAEVANSLINTLAKPNTPVFILEGNHDKMNEKGIGHGLNYLSPYATIIDSPQVVNGLAFIPYQSSNNKFLEYVDLVPKNTIIIAHQGFKGAFMGDYIQDKSSVDPNAIVHKRIFSGHYHRHQTLGTVTYIGSPYTITFGEANDGPKGYLVLNDDGTFTRETLELRKHIIVEMRAKEVMNYVSYTKDYVKPEDLVWIKIKGTESELRHITKEVVKIRTGLENFKLELIEDVSSNTLKKEMGRNFGPLNPNDIFNNIIDGLQDSKEEKEALKSLYKELLNETK